MFTQPLMYQKIRKHKTPQQIYVERLLKEGSVKKEQVRAISDRIQQILHDAYESAKDYKSKKIDWLSSVWHGFMSPSQHSRIRNTGVPMELLKSVGQAMTTVPEGVSPIHSW